MVDTSGVAMQGPKKAVEDMKTTMRQALKFAKMSKIRGHGRPETIVWMGPHPSYLLGRKRWRI